MRSCTMAANRTSCSSVRPFSDLRRNRRERSRRLTWLRPAVWQMDTALAEKAVEKFRRGPTSTTCPPAEVRIWLPFVSFSGSKVSCRSHWRTSFSLSAISAASDTLKHCSVSMPVNSGMTFCAFLRRVASAVLPRPGVRYHCTTSTAVSVRASSAMAALVTVCAREVEARVPWESPVTLGKNADSRSWGANTRPAVPRSWRRALPTSFFRQRRAPLRSAMAPGARALMAQACMVR
mmetsp:Transcript_23438/g.39207  ORF Transcript_23438/g.39207 Transcript_23438/m.39207 type:complete len:235 (-) Transcript_23438:107-811(-)